MGYRILRGSTLRSSTSLIKLKVAELVPFTLKLHRVASAWRSFTEGGGWPTPLIAFVTLANFASTEAAYALLSVIAVSHLLGSVEALRQPPPAALLCVAAALASHTPLLAAASPLRPTPLALAFAASAAVIEELYFRGVLLPRLELLPQAFAFALSHMRLTDPVALVESALLFPHYMLLGVAFGLAAEVGGYPTSAVTHAAYNLIAISYILPLDVNVVGLLVLSDLAAVAVALAAKRLLGNWGRGCRAEPR